MAHAPTGPLDTLWRPTTLIWILVAGVALSLVLALAPGLDGDRPVYFGLTTLLGAGLPQPHDHDGDPLFGGRPHRRHGAHAGYRDQARTGPNHDRGEQGGRRL